jgi:hypothetical protein
VFEARAMYIAQAMGAKVVKSIERDRTVPKSFKKKDFVLADTSNLDLSTIITFLDRLKQADPTPNHQYLQWITKRYCEGDFHFEDLERVKDEVEAFHNYKPRLKRDRKPTDINQYKSTAEVFALVEDYRTENVAPSQKEAGRRQEHQLIVDGKAYWKYQGETIKVIVPRTKEAAIHFGKGTRWCTSATQRNYFDIYNKEGPLYIIMSDSGKYQFHFQSHQYMTALDQRVTLGPLIKQYPELKDAFDDIAQSIGFIPLMKIVTSEGLLAALQSSLTSRNVQYFQDGFLSIADLLDCVDKRAQNEKIALLVVGHDPSLALRLIRPDLQQLASFQSAIIERRPELLQSANPAIQTPQLVSAVLRRAPTMLRYVRHDLMEKSLLLEAVKTTPEVLGQVPIHLQDIDVIKCAMRATTNRNTKRRLINMVHDLKLRKYLSDALKEAS